ncbi:GILT-like protein 3 [Musca vetustissima]|uniref:GILT-like protein 3 n=1 Tax=Musca vetustissima TaxID=27455 RepID=UPI002AB7D9FB|nr:GILT-like protein 3 [Musca vetustissima]
MKSFVSSLSFLCAIIVLTNAELEFDKLKVEIYYETLCPDSMRFVRNQLYGAMIDGRLLQFSELVFIPYGKVGSWTNPSTNETTLYCQHGNRECELNALHACIVEHNTMREQLDMITCLLNGYSTDVDTCATQLNIDVTAAKNCKATRSTVDILKKYGDMTDAIDMTFVPSIGLGGVFDPWKQRSILHNFARVFCRKYREKYDVDLQDCY